MLNAHHDNDCGCCRAVVFQASWAGVFWHWYNEVVLKNCGALARERDRLKIVKTPWSCSADAECTRPGFMLMVFLLIRLE